MRIIMLYIKQKRDKIREVKFFVGQRLNTGKIKIFNNKIWALQINSLININKCTKINQEWVLTFIKVYDAQIVVLVTIID